MSRDLSFDRRHEEAVSAAAKAVAQMWRLGRVGAATAIHEAFVGADPELGLEGATRAQTLEEVIVEGQNGWARTSGEEGADPIVCEWIAGELEKIAQGIDAGRAAWLADKQAHPQAASVSQTTQRALDACVEMLAQRENHGWSLALSLWAEAHPPRIEKIGEGVRELLGAGQGPSLTARAGALLLHDAPSGSYSSAPRTQADELVESMPALARRSLGALAAAIAGVCDLCEQGGFPVAEANSVAQHALEEWAAQQNNATGLAQGSGEAARVEAHGPFFAAIKKFSERFPDEFWSAQFWQEAPTERENTRLRGAQIKSANPPPTRWESLRCACWTVPVGREAANDDPATSWWLALSQNAASESDHPLAQAEFFLGRRAFEKLFLAPETADQTLLRAHKESLLDLDWSAWGVSMGEWIVRCANAAKKAQGNAQQWTDVFSAMAGVVSFAPGGALFRGEDDASRVAGVALMAVSGGPGHGEKLTSLAVEGLRELGRRGSALASEEAPSVTVERAWKLGMAKLGLQPKAAWGEPLAAAMEALSLAAIANEARASSHSAAHVDSARKTSAQRL